MSESIGRKLSQARLKRGLTIEEAAHATKLRPDKIVALENDDYGGFPSNAYIKGFLKNYARYLGIDVTAFLGTLDSSLHISVSDYQYLSNAPERPLVPEPLRRERRPPSILPLVGGAAAIAIALMGFWVYANAQRIFGDSQPRKARTTAEPLAAPSTPAQVAPAIDPALDAPASLSLEPAPAGDSAETHPVAPKTDDDHAPLNPSRTADPADHDFVTPKIVPTPEPTAEVSPASGVNEILVASVKKTWITVRKDDPKSPPVFEDFVYPDAHPLKLRGARFFIEARDPDAVQITKNGLPIAYQAPGVPIQ